MDETRMLYANELGKTNFTLYNNHDKINQHYSVSVLKIMQILSKLLANCTIYDIISLDDYK